MVMGCGGIADVRAVAILAQGESEVQWNCCFELLFGQLASLGRSPGMALHQLATEQEVLSWSSLEDVVTWAGMKPSVWQQVNMVLGGDADYPFDLKELAAVPIAWLADIGQWRIRPDDERFLTLQHHRHLTVLERIQVGFVYRGARRKMGLNDIDPFASKEDSGLGRSTSSSSGSIRSCMVDSAVHKGKKRNATQVRGKREGGAHSLSTCIEESDGEDDICMEENSKYKEDLTRDLMGALRDRVCDLGMSPYADFALLAPHDWCYWRFTNHVLQPDGTIKEEEVPGPPNYDSWYSSWKIYRSTLLTVTRKTGGTQLPIVTPTALDRYLENFKTLVLTFPEAWHILVVAEDKCRLERVTKIKARAEGVLLAGAVTAYNPKMPWDYVFEAAAADQGYWDRNVREPALIWWRENRARRLTEEVEGTGNDSPKRDETGEPGGNAKGKAKVKEEGETESPSMNEEVTANAEREREDRKRNAHIFDGVNTKDKWGRLMTNGVGARICFDFNNGLCEEPCPKEMLHACQWCLGNHISRRCDRGGGGGPARAR